MTLTIGVDEVGRGCLAGSVVCCAYAHDYENFDKIATVDDSKKLSAKKRDILESKIIESGFYFIDEIDEKIIDKFNILNATMWCMQKSVISLLINHFVEYDFKEIKISIDGNHNPFSKKFFNSTLLTDTELNIYNKICTNSKIECIIKGDGLIYEISCASILAKQFRDKQMIELHNKINANYGWDKNMGYGTKSHINAIEEFGFTPVHRLTFIRKFI